MNAGGQNVDPSFRVSLTKVQCDLPSKHETLSSQHCTGVQCNVVCNGSCRVSQNKWDFSNRYVKQQSTNHCQVSAWQTATLLPISCKSEQPVPARVEEPVSTVRQSLLVVVTRTIHPFSRCPKPARESRLSELVVYYQCVIRHRRRTRPITRRKLNK